MRLHHPCFLKLIIFISVNSSFTFSQTDTSFHSADSTVIIKRVTPGKKYDVNWINRIFSGEHWRDLWATEIDAQVLDLGRFAGGLIPIKQGGGLQSKSLRLRGEDKNEYKFRTIDKFPYKSLPPEWQNSYYGKLLQDQVSIGLPVSSLIVYPLMKAVNILCVKPKIVIMPDDERLGKFKKDFAGQLGIIEQNPRAGKKGLNNFEGADKVVNGFKIFNQTEKDNDEQIDQVEFLKARLMDIYLGDRDRHADQWQWAGYKKNGKRIWRPIPRDRDFAFGRYDGVFPWLSGVLSLSLVGFNYDIPQIEEITYTGRHLDRRFINKPDKQVWDSIANYLTMKLTDDVLLNAIKEMPVEMYAKEGRNLLRMLKSRRSQLKEASDEYYKVLSEVVDVYGSNKKEFAEAEVLNEKELEVSLYDNDKSSGNKNSDPFYKRKFSSDYTDEIRIHLLKGDDQVLIKGKAENDILIRIISDEGKDEITDSSEMNIKIYDEDKNTKISSLNGVYFNDDKVEVPDKPIEKYEPELEDRYNFWAFTPVLNYDTDDGLIFGGGPNFKQYGFRADPYLYYLQLTGAYATAAKDYDFKIYADFNKLIHNSRVEIFFSASELDFNRYYGSGNQTVRDPVLASQNYYKARQQNIIFSPVVTLRLSKNFNLLFRGSYRYSNVTENYNSDNLLGQIKPYGFGKISDISISAGFTFLKVDNTISPKKGINSLLNINYFPNIFDLKTDFSNIYAEITGYYTFKTFTDLTFILKAGGKNNFGNYVFYEAAEAGGSGSIRGYPRERFQGDAALFGQSELRIKIASADIFLPAIFGLSVISDIGRVFNPGEDSKMWHSTYGGGIWFEIEKTVSINFLAARSNELTEYYISLGLGL